MLQAGSLVPADCLLLQAIDLYADEALLTGETMPVRKEVVPIQEAKPTLAQMRNTLFQGTHIRSGSALALAVRTGASTELGRIASRLKLKAPATEFELGIRHFGALLLEVTLVLILVIFALNVWLQRPVLDSLLFSLALAVGLVPQLLPAIISINLSRGAQAMARKKVIVKRLAAIENFGSMEILCTDKTGTLTEGRVQLSLACDPRGEASEEVFLAGALNAGLQSGLRNPIDEALLAQKTVDLTPYQKRGEIPYDFLRKRLSVAVLGPDGATHLVTKGALEKVLEVCTKVRLKEQEVPLESEQEEIRRRYAAWSAQGYRVLGVSWRALPEGVCHVDGHPCEVSTPPENVPLSPVENVSLSPVEFATS